MPSGIEVIGKEMTPERWNRISAVLDEVIELESDRRSAFLNDACSGDEGLRKEIEALLSSDERFRNFLESSPSGAAAELLSESLLLEAGTQLARRYEIGPLLGEGGMAEVYQGKDLRLGRQVAVKVLPPHFAADRQAISRFEREARILASLNHPNILAIYDFDNQDGRYFVVTEFLNGETLRDYSNRSTVHWQKSIEIISAVAEGLSAAHSKGIIHRDLKPENIFLTSDDHVKILDFGLANWKLTVLSEAQNDQTTPLTKTGPGTILGTLPYMSPEQVRGDPMDERSDIFSLGCVLYEMLSGSRPFSGKTNADLISSILHQNPPEILSSRSIPPAFTRIARKCLEKDPDMRFQSAKDLILALSRLSRKLRSPFRILRRPVVAIPLVIAVVAMVLLAVWNHNRQEKIRLARDEILPKVERIIEQTLPWESRTAAYGLAVQAEKYIPGDPKLAGLMDQCSTRINITTKPQGAKVYMKEYASPQSPWQYVGITPVQKVRLPKGTFRWKFEKEGYEVVLAADTNFQEDTKASQPAVPHNIERTLDRIGTIPPGMVRVPATKTTKINTYLQMGEFELGDFLIDRYEVTNRQYREFVREGGYQKRDYWKQKFLKDGKEIPWEEAMRVFTDKTGVPGPATWEGGDYPVSRGDDPVSGVSWYEAAAYAHFAGKSLPTAFHWGVARGEYTPVRVAVGFGITGLFSNFRGTGPVPAGSLQGITPYGAFDMAGNVREWCWNETAKGRLIRGGAWGDPSYMFDFFSQAPAMDRDPRNGFRCALYLGPGMIPTVAFQDVSALMFTPWPDFYKMRPVPDPVFEVYKEHFAYDRTDLDVRTESRKTSEEWTREKVSFAAAYGGERVAAYLYLPRNTKPPFQTVIYWASGDAYFNRSSEDIDTRWDFPLWVSFIVENGRAVLFPVIKGMYERGNEAMVASMINSWDAGGGRQYAELLTQMVKDYRRSMDYLETRDDIDTGRFALYGVSLGGGYGAYVPAVEARLKASVLVAGGMHPMVFAEANQVNYVGRVKIPTLMLWGRYDTTFPYEAALKPMFDLMGTTARDKQMKLYDTDHIPPKAEIIKETLAWLDRYLGPVRR